MAQSQNFFPISVWYSGGKARAPMLSPITPQSEAEWQRDLEQIRALGFNTVRTWVEWAHAEPQPGQYRFKNLELLSRLAEKTGLKVIIQMYADSAPDWVGKQYPDALFVAQSGETVPSQAAPGYCTDHEGVGQAVQRFYTETAKVAVRYPNFFGWDLWSEPHILNWAIINYVPNVQFCYCPHTQERFRRWLQKKYEDLDALNAAWYRNFESWDDVEPPRFGTILSYTDFIDWKNFIYDKMAEDLRARRDAILKADPNRVITAHAAVPSVFTSPFSGVGEADDFLMAREVDFYGTSLYPKHSFPDRHWERWKLLLAIEFSRCAGQKNGGFYVGELQAGFGTRGLVVGDPVTAADHRVWMGSAIAGGAKALNLFAYYPMASGYESGGYGLIHLDGEITERARQSGSIARMVHENSELFATSRPVKAEVALVYNPLAQMIGGEQNCGPENALRDSLVGYWYTLREKNIPVDFIHRRQLESGDLSGYKLIVLPYPVMFPQAAAEGLKRFIEAGGCAVAEARLGCNDDRGFAAKVIPGMGLSEVFGVREERVKMQGTVGIRLGETSHPALAKLNPGQCLTGAYFAESFKPLDESAIEILGRLEDGSPAMVASRFGKGQTIIIGAFLGLGQLHAPHSLNARFIQNLPAWAGVEIPFTTSLDEGPNQAVDIRLHEHGQGLLLFAVNHGDQTKEFTCSLNVSTTGDYTIEDLMQNAKTRMKVESAALKLQIALPPKDTRILDIRPSGS